ncbi:MAG: hypothetical protein ACAH59_01690 [Pseudobdellovibrionaceae bacterium]
MTKSKLAFGVLLIFLAAAAVAQAKGKSKGSQHLDPIPAQACEDLEFDDLIHSDCKWSEYESSQGGWDESEDRDSHLDDSWGSEDSEGGWESELF